MHEQKIDKSKNYCYLSNKTASFDAVIGVIPEFVLEEISAKALGSLVDAIWASWEKTKKIHEQDIIAEGAIFDSTTGKMVELCQK